MPKKSFKLNYSVVSSYLKSEGLIFLLCITVGSLIVLRFPFRFQSTRILKKLGIVDRQVEFGDAIKTRSIYLTKSVKLISDLVRDLP